MYDEFKALGVEFLAMSTDSRFIHKMWQEHELSKMVEGGVPFPMLSDGGGKIGAIYGVYDEAAGVDIRGRAGVVVGEGTPFSRMFREALVRRGARMHPLVSPQESGWLPVVQGAELVVAAASAPGEIRGACPG